MNNIKKIGEKHEVWKGLAKQTKHGYTKKDIIRRGKPGSYRYKWKAKSQAAKKLYNSNPKVKKALQTKQRQLQTKGRLTRKKKSLIKRIFDI